MSILKCANIFFFLQNCFPFLKHLLIAIGKKATTNDHKVIVKLLYHISYTTNQKKYSL